MTGVIDIEAMPNCPTSKFLTKEEVMEIDPNWNQNRINFIFKYNIPITVSIPMAKILVNKYSSLQYKDGDEEVQTTEEEYYEEYTYNELKKLAVKSGMPYKETFVKRDALIMKIKELNGTA